MILYNYEQMLHDKKECKEREHNLMCEYLQLNYSVCDLFVF